MEDSGIDSDPKTINHVEDERLFLGSDSSCSSSHTQTSQWNTTKQLQKKLGIGHFYDLRKTRIEQAKRIQRNSDYIKLPKHDNENTSSSSSAGLISIQRLPIPHKNKEHCPLVEYIHSESESEDEMTLFPTKSKDPLKHKQDLTDTFSIEELSDESEDSLNLDPAQPPHPFMQTYIPTGCFACHCHIL